MHWTLGSANTNATEYVNISSVSVGVSTKRYINTELWYAGFPRFLQFIKNQMTTITYHINAKWKALTTIRLRPEQICREDWFIWRKVTDWCVRSGNDKLGYCLCESDECLLIFAAITNKIRVVGFTVALRMWLVYLNKSSEGINQIVSIECTPHMASYTSYVVEAGTPRRVYGNASLVAWWIQCVVSQVSTRTYWHYSGNERWAMERRYIFVLERLHKSHPIQEQAKCVMSLDSGIATFDNIVRRKFCGVRVKLVRTM